MEVKLKTEDRYIIIDADFGASITDDKGRYFSKYDIPT